MQNLIVSRESKKIYNSSSSRLRQIPYINSKQDFFGILPYNFTNEALKTIQQVYSKENRYVRSAIQTIEGVKATIYVDCLLGIKKEMNYVPASTISAIVSQCSALVLWVALRKQTDDPKDIYNRLVENELVGFRKERLVYHKRIPLKTEINATVQITHLVRYSGNIIAKVRINLGAYMDAEIIEYAFLSKI